MMPVTKIRLAQILGIHPLVTEYAQLVAGNLYTVPLEELSHEAAIYLLTLHPIVAVHSEDSAWQVIAGFRSYQLAIAKLDPSTSINVSCLKRVFSNESIRRIAVADIIASPLMLGLGSKPHMQVQRLCEGLSPTELADIHSDLSSSRGIKRLLRGNYD